MIEIKVRKYHTLIDEIWHEGGPVADEPIRAAAIVPSSVKVGGMGARRDVPLGHINAAYVRSHFSAMEVGINDAPRANEIAFALAMTTGGRIHERVGGLKVSEIKGKDGLR